MQLELHLGTEFTTTRVRGATPDELAERAIGGRHILFELIPRTGRADALAALEAVRAAGLDAIVGHPERSVDVQHDPTIVEELRSGGALIQVVGPSLSAASRMPYGECVEPPRSGARRSRRQRRASAEQPVAAARPGGRPDRTAFRSGDRGAVARRDAFVSPPLVLGGAVAAEERGGGEQDDLQVEPERPVLDVVVVPLDAVGERRLAAQAVDLRPAGDARP